MDLMNAIKLQLQLRLGRAAMPTHEIPRRSNNPNRVKNFSPMPFLSAYGCFAVHVHEGRTQ